MRSSSKTTSAPEHLVSSVTSSSPSSTFMMIPSREEGHQVPPNCVTSSSQQQQSLTNVKQVNASHRQSWHDLSHEYASCQTVPRSHQERTARHPPPDFVNFPGGSYQDQSLPLLRNQWTGFEPNTWSHDDRTTTYHRHSDPHGSTNSMAQGLSFYYANYYHLQVEGGEQRFLQRQNSSAENSGNSSMFFPPQSVYNEYPTNWNTLQPTLLPTPVDINQQSLIHSSGIIFQAPTETDVLDIGAEGNATSRSLYRQPQQASCKSYNDDGKAVVALSSSSSSSLSSSAAAAAAAEIISRRRSDEGVSSVVNCLSGESSSTALTSSVTSSSQSQRPKAVTSGGQSASSSSIGKTRTREKYRTVYTEQQKVELEREYEKGTFINAQRKADVAKEVRLTERQVKIWFQNRRAKDRRLRRKAAAEGETGETGEEEDDDEDEDCVVSSVSHVRRIPVHSSIAPHQGVHSAVRGSDAMRSNCSASYDQPMYEYLRTDRCQ